MDKESILTENEDWVGLADFLSSINYWRLIQEKMAPTLGRRGYELLRYGAPYLDGDRLRIPNGPAFARDSEGYRDYSILRDSEGFSIRSTGISRANEFTDNVESWFGNFQLIAKYFLYSQVCTPTFNKLDQAGEEKLTDAVDDKGLLPSWTSREIEGPTGYPRQQYFNCANPDEFYMTFNGDTRTSQIITKTFREINELYAGELALDRLGIPLPETTT